jgi:hypothetical protein
MMTRKDYVATAEILNTYATLMPEAIFKNLVFDIGAMFISDNPRFDTNKFIDAVFKEKN